MLPEELLQHVAAHKLSPPAAALLNFQSNLYYPLGFILLPAQQTFGATGLNFSVPNIKVFK